MTIEENNIKFKMILAQFIEIKIKKRKFNFCKI